MKQTNEHDVRRDKIVATLLAFAVFVGGITACVVSYHSTQIEAIKVQNQHEIEMTKQKAIEMDKAKKRKIWERPMPMEDSDAD